MQRRDRCLACERSRHRSATERMCHVLMGGGLAAAILGLWACTRTTIPVTLAPPPTLMSMEPTPVVAPTATLIPGDWPIGASPNFTYAVVWTPAQQLVDVYQPAGITGSVVDALAYDQRDLRLTGGHTEFGSSMWVELIRPGGGTGWVNGWNLTEQFSADAFCDDPRIRDLISRFQAAVTQSDGEGLAALSSPKRGLVVRYFPKGGEAALSLTDVSLLFSSRAQFEWGIDPESGRGLTGTFRDLVLPELNAVLEATPEATCNVLKIGDSAVPVAWPAEYTNLNFLSLFTPPAEGASQYEWRAWGVGIEFVDGTPYVTVLVRFRGEI